MIIQIIFFVCNIFILEKKKIFNSYYLIFILYKYYSGGFINIYILNKKKHSDK